MYQGKFDKKRKGTTQDILEITAERNAAAAASQKKAAAQEQSAAPKKRNMPYDQDAHRAPVREQPAKPAP